MIFLENLLKDSGHFIVEMHWGFIFGCCVVVSWKSETWEVNIKSYVERNLVYCTPSKQVSYHNSCTWRPVCCWICLNVNMSSFFSKWYHLLSLIVYSSMYGVPPLGGSHTMPYQFLPFLMTLIISFSEDIYCHRFFIWCISPFHQYSCSCVMFLLFTIRAWVILYVSWVIK